MERPVAKGDIDLRGVELDPATRCAHYHGPLDIVAIRLRCCDTYFGCRECHDALAGHAAEVWPASEWQNPAILCGACGHQLTVTEYLAASDRCPACGAGFNPGCRKHYHLYFDVAENRDPENQMVAASVNLLSTTSERDKCG